MTRRSLFALSAAAALPLTPATAAAGRLKQSVARWCYAKIPLDDLCREAARIGLAGIDLVNSEEWPKIGRASCRERGEISEVGGSLKEKDETRREECVVR